MGDSCGEQWNKSWGGSNWQNRLGGQREDSWGGGNWMDRVGLGSLREEEEDKSESVQSTTVPDDAGDLSDVDDDKIDSLTAEDKAKLHQMRAMRRRALTARFNKADTIRTSGRGATDYA